MYRANSSLESCLRRSRSRAGSAQIDSDADAGEKGGRFEPDCTASVSVRGRYFGLFLVEVKKPNRTRREDLEKLDIMLKSIFDELVPAGVAQPAVCCLLVDRT